MAERPALYRIFRLGDAVTLGLVARGADHGHRHRGPNRGPQRRRSLGGRQGARLPARGSKRGPAVRAAKRSGLPGRDPAIGGPYAAVISGGDQIRILNRFNREPIGSVGAPGAEAVAISKGWLAYLTVEGRALRAEGAADRASRESRQAEADRLRLEPGPDRPSERRRRARLLRGLEATRGTRSSGATCRSGKGGTVVRSRTAAALESIRARKAPPLRAGQTRPAGPAGDQAAEAPPEPDAEADRRQGRGHRIYSRGERRQLWSTSLSAQARLRHPARAAADRRSSRSAPLADRVPLRRAPAPAAGCLRPRSRDTGSRSAWRSATARPRFAGR